MEQRLVRVTEEDIQAAQRFGVSSALLHLLANETGTIWRLAECGVGIEVMPPFRTVIIWREQADSLRLQGNAPLSEPCSLVVDIYDYGSTVIPLPRNPSSVGGN